MPTRRAFILGGTVIAAAAVAASKPADRGGPYAEYFARLNRTLRTHGIDRPVLVIDLDRLDRNIDRVASSVAVAPAKTYRVVVKSLPSPALVDYVATRRCRRHGSNLPVHPWSARRSTGSLRR